MWHEARRQERKIRGMLVDYRKRAERRRDFYEKIKADPTQFLQVHGRQCKIHLDPAIAAAADSAVMMPWQGNANNLIDRFDVRAHLDYIPAVSKEEDTELTQEERHLNYERYRIIAQNAYLSISEEKFLKQLHLEEQFGYTENKTRKEPKGTGAAIGFNYEDGTAITAPSASNESPEENFDDENSDSDLDVDLAINVSKIDSTQAHEMNKHGQHFGMAGNDFYSFLTNDMEEAESYKLAKEEEHEKALFSGRKSRRERRAHRERRLANRKISPPSYAAKESPTNPSIKEDSKSPSRSPSPDAGKITYITSFGDDEEPQSSIKQTYADKVKYGKKHNPSSDRLIYFGYKSRSSSREVCYLKRKRSHSRSKRSRSHTRARRSRSRNRRSDSRSPSRRSRYNYSHDRSRSSSKRARSVSRSRSRSYNKRKSSASRSRSKSKTDKNNKKSRSRSRSRWSRSASRDRRSRSRSQHSSKPYRRRSSSSSSLSSSSSSLRSRSRSKSPVKKPSVSRSKSKTPVPPSPPRIIRYYGRRKSDHSSSESSSSDDDSGEMKPENPVSSYSRLQSGNNSGIASKGSSTLSVIERLKMKRQALINRQFKRDKIAEVQKLEREKQEQQNREDELREMAIKLRRRQREKRHAYDRSSSSDSDKSSTSRKRDRSSSPKSREKETSRSDRDKEDREKRSRSRDRSRRETRDRSRDAERRRSRSRSRSHRYGKDKEERAGRGGKSPESKETARKLVDY